MPIRINTVAMSLLAVVLLASFAGSASADSEDPRAASERRWTPSLAFWSGVTIQNQDATTSSRCQTGGPPTTIQGKALPACSVPPILGPADMRPPQEEDEDVVSPLVGGSLQLMTPTLEFVPFRPRIFASAELVTYYSPQRKIAREGDPSGARAPDLVPNLGSVPAVALLGVGSETASEVQLLGYGAKLGLAFPFELFGRRLWIKPAAGWTRYEVDIEGIVVHGIKDDLDNEPPDQWGEELRSITLLGNDSLMMDAVGPGAELELEAGTFGPLGASIFFDLHAYRVLGDRDVAFDATRVVNATTNPDGFTPLGNPGTAADTYSASWSWEADPWLWRTTAGMRIQWLGF